MVVRMKCIRAILSSVLICLVFYHPSAHALFQATVDRDSLGADETLVLTLQSDGAGRADSPDWGPLMKDFEVLSTSQSSQYRLNGGSLKSSRSWQLTLSPKRTGKLLVPSLTLNGESSPALVVTVLDPGTSVKQHAGNAANELVFMRAEVDRQELYPQTQLLYTLRLYSAVPATGGFENFAVEGAVVQALEPHQYSKRMNGIDYQVWEYQFAIFPQRPGELLIPAYRFHGSLQSGHFADFWGGGRTGGAINLSSEPISVKVKQAPVPDGSHWLGARKVELSEEWRGDSAELQIGQSVTRRVFLRAEGVLASALPEILPTEISGAKVYAEQPQTEQTQNGTGTVAKRSETIAVVPTQTGELKFPAVAIKWWDTESAQWREATLPARSIRVRATGHDSEQPTPAFLTPSPSAADTSTNVDAGRHTWFWPVATGIMSCLWLITLVAWWRQRPTQLNSSLTHRPASSHSSRDLLLDVRKACLANDALKARQAIQSWASIMWPGQKLHTLEDVAEQCGDDAIASALRDLDATLYGTAQGRWTGTSLSAALKNLQMSPAAHEPNGTLTELYPRG